MSDPTELACADLRTHVLPYGKVIVTDADGRDAGLPFFDTEAEARAHVQRFYPGADLRYRQHNGAVRVYYSADVVSPDAPCDGAQCCSCTDVYGDGYEHGCGATLESGWLDPDYTLWEVWPDREDVRPDELDLAVLEDGDTVAGWLADTIADRLGAVDQYDGEATFYAADEQRDLRTDVSVRIAAHVSGATKQDVAAAYERMKAV